MKPLFIGLLVFVAVAILTQYVAYQRYLISRDAELQKVIHEINVVKDRVQTLLGSSLSATKTLSFIVEKYGVPEDFDVVAKNIIESNKYIDALQLTKGGMITHVYPIQGNESVIGYNILEDSLRNKEAYRAIEKRELFFAGPFELKQGGMAIVGRLPIFINNHFWGFSVVLVKLSTLLSAAGIDTLQNSEFLYQLSKINPDTKREEFFLSAPTPLDNVQFISIEVPDGEWNLHVMSKGNAKIFYNAVTLSILGFVLSATCGLFAWHLARQPEKLNKLVQEKTIQLTASEKYFRSLIEKSWDAVVLLDSKGQVLYQSPSTQRISGYSVQEIQSLDGLGLIHPDDQEEISAAFTQLRDSPGSTISRKLRFKHKKGHYIWLQGTYTNLLEDENVKAIVYNYHDITEQTEAEHKAITARRLYQVISQINHTIIHVNDEQALFQEICRIAVELGKFRMTWIGMIDEVEKKVFPVTHAGVELEYLSYIHNIPLDDEVLSLGPTGKAIHTGTYVLCNDIENDPLVKPWAAHALARGYHSSISLPIKKFDKVVGAFNLYASTPYYFDEQEIELLEETVNNISFTLENFEREKMRKDAERQIAAEKLLSGFIINSLPGIFYLYDEDGRFMRWNKNFEIISGYSFEEISMMHPLDFFDDKEKKLLKNKIELVFSTGSADVTAHFYTREKKKIPYFFNGQKVTFNGTDFLIGMGIDITDRVKAENELRKRTEEIQKLTTYLEQVREEERTRIAREIHDELGQQLTGLKMDASWIGKKINNEDKSITEKLSTMISLIDETVKTVRRISSELRPGILDDLGLIPALEWQCQEFEKRTGIKSTFKTNLKEYNPNHDLSTNIFRIYQEALTNVARHAQATCTETSLDQQNGAIVLTIKDDGYGFDMQEAKLKNSLGLIGMRERALLFQGKLIIESEKRRGTVITLKIPFVGKL